MEHENNLNMYKFSTEDEDFDCSLDLDDELYAHVPFQFGCALSPEAKDYLTLPTTERDDKSTQNVLTELDKLEFFQKFPNATKQKLCKKMIYSSFQDMEYLLRQGEDVLDMYVLLTGIVSLRYNVLAPTVQSGSETQWPERILRRGAHFGHADLLRRRPSTVDAYSVGYSEVLMLNEKDFGIAKNPLKVEQLRLKELLRTTITIQMFGWSDEEFHALEIFSKMDSYLEMVEVYNGAHGTRPKWSHFLVAGECSLSRVVSYYASQLGSSSMRFIAVQVHERHQKVVKKDLQFRTIVQGSYFGVGEDFGRNRVMAYPACECLLVMRLVLAFKDSQRLQDMANALTESLPSDQVLVDNFLNHENASKEVEDMMKEMLEDKPREVIDGERQSKKPAFKKFV